MIEDLKERLPRDAALPVISLTLYRGIINLDLKADGHSATVIHLDDGSGERGGGENACNDQQDDDRTSEGGVDGRNAVAACDGYDEQTGGEDSGRESNLLENVLGLLQFDASLEEVAGARDSGHAGVADSGLTNHADSDGVGPDYPYSAHDTIDRDRFYRWFAKGKEHIARGDVYQLQLGHEIQVDSRIPPFQVYRRLRHQVPSPYMYYFVTPQGVHVIGASPEFFIGLTPDGDITLRPIAGTVGNPGEGGRAGRPSDS